MLFAYVLLVKPLDSRYHHFVVCELIAATIIMIDVKKSHGSNCKQCDVLQATWLGPLYTMHSQIKEVNEHSIDKQLIRRFVTSPVCVINPLCVQRRITH